MKKVKITILKTTLDKELAKEYGKPNVAICSCNDGLRPVIMKLEATEEEVISENKNGEEK